MTTPLLHPTPKLIVISAPSGAGKTTLCQKLLEKLPGLIPSISTTTRAPRGKELHGREYYFTSQASFKDEIEAGTFAEWAMVHGNYYGTSRKTLDHHLGQGQSVLLDIDVQGASQLRRSYPTRTYTIFVSPPSIEELERRLRSRGTDREEVILRRLQAAKVEMAARSSFDYSLVNDEMERALTELYDVVRKAVGFTE
jgi:guanylate kinase